MKKYNLPVLLFLGILLTAGCGKNTNTNNEAVVQGVSKTTLLNARTLQQFAPTCL